MGRRRRRPTLRVCSARRTAPCPCLSSTPAKGARGRRARRRVPHRRSRLRSCPAGVRPSLSRPDLRAHPPVGRSAGRCRGRAAAGGRRRADRPTAGSTVPRPIRKLFLREAYDDRGGGDDVHAGPHGVRLVPALREQRLIVGRRDARPGGVELGHPERAVVRVVPDHDVVDLRVFTKQIGDEEHASIREHARRERINRI